MITESCSSWRVCVSDGSPWPAEDCAACRFTRCPRVGMCGARVRFLARALQLKHTWIHQHAAKLCWWRYRYSARWRFAVWQVLHAKLKALWSFEMLRTTQTSTQSHIPADLQIVQYAVTRSPLLQFSLNNLAVNIKFSDFFDPSFVSLLNLHYHVVQ